MLVTSSRSKNFGLYRDRVGALIVCAQNAEKLTDLRSQLAFLARNLWSTPAGAWRRGGRGDPRRQRVEGTLAGRGRRHALAHRQPAHRPGRSPGAARSLLSASPMSARNAGCFSYTGLSPQQVAWLR
ncbi:aminotransferase class I/II-fold pyridoxal phosphate-dependent enzyme [Pseudomonas aeruginosa]